MQKYIKNCNQNKIVCWVSFNIHEYPKIHYRIFLLLFKPFFSVETNLQNQHVLWKDVYTNEKENIEKI
jgi:hypothetical protein